MKRLNAQFNDCNQSKHFYFEFYYYLLYYLIKLRMCARQQVMCCTVNFGSSKLKARESQSVRHPTKSQPDMH